MGLIGEGGGTGACSVFGVLGKWNSRGTKFSYIGDIIHINDVGVYVTVIHVKLGVQEEAIWRFEDCQRPMKQGSMGLDLHGMAAGCYLCFLPRRQYAVWGIAIFVIKDILESWSRLWNWEVMVDYGNDLPLLAWLCICQQLTVGDVEMTFTAVHLVWCLQSHVNGFGFEDRGFVGKYSN